MSKIAVPFRVFYEFAQVFDTACEIVGLAPADLRGALTVHPVLVQPLRALRVRDLARGPGDVRLLLQVRRVLPQVMNLRLQVRDPLPQRRGVVMVVPVQGRVVMVVDGLPGLLRRRGLRRVMLRGLRRGVLLVLQDAEFLLQLPGPLPVRVRLREQPLPGGMRGVVAAARRRGRMAAGALRGTLPAAAAG